MKKFLFFLLLTTSYYLLATKSFAEGKNIFGLHLTQTSDISSAAKIVNSSGGDWGWVTVVIRTDQLNHQKWQEFFDKCRQYHIIPIVRLATILDQGNWKVPSITDIDNLANFLHSLNWPSIPQHILLFNEINHPGEWGGGVDVKNYTDIALYTIDKFKSLNSNFFILSTGLDLASPDKAGYLSASTVYQQINAYKPEYFQKIDGLASHSYPNHGFIGKPTDYGRHSIRGYSWEIDYLKKLGINRSLPVFITETGWPHREGVVKDNRFYTAGITAKYLQQALQIWQGDSRVKAVTPFIYNYITEPFDHFSWLDIDENLYTEYQSLVDMPKTVNNPNQITRYEAVSNHLPFFIAPDNQVSGHIVLKNTGQSIWGETTSSSFCLTPQTTPNVSLSPICLGRQTILPGQSASFDYLLTINSVSDHNGPAMISWENLPGYEITPLNSSATIYSPKDNLFNSLLRYLRSLFI